RKRRQYLVHGNLHLFHVMPCLWSALQILVDMAPSVIFYGWRLIEAQLRQIDIKSGFIQRGFDAGCSAQPGVKSL
ncbi:MAG: hypothetical protein AAFZ04_06080, partial [Pseudomonadota bacterium]